MRTVETTTAGLPDYAPVPRSAFGPALNEHGYYVGRVERNLYWVTDGTYQSAFLTTADGVVLLDAPPTIGHNLQRAVDEIAAANGVTNKVTHLIYSHHSSLSEAATADGTPKSLNEITGARPVPPERPSDRAICSR
jgi:hypothetical protein